MELNDIKTDNGHLDTKKPIKIVLYTDAFWPNIGGGESYCVDLAKTLTLRGEKVTVVTPIMSTKEGNFNFKVIRMKKPVTIGFNINFIEPFFEIVEEKPDLIHFSGPAITDFFLIPLLKILGYPIVLTFHASFNSKVAGGMMKILAPLVFRFVNTVMVQSRRDEEYLLQLNVPKDRVCYSLYNGIDTETFSCRYPKEEVVHQNDPKPLRFVFVGGLTKSRPYKGYDILLDFFSELSNNKIDPLPELIVVGTGDLLSVLKEQSKKSKNITFRGKLAEFELVNQLCNSDVFILPSKSVGEGFGKVALEAISCGKPVFVSKFAGISELVKKYEAGIVFDPFDFESFLRDTKAINSDRSLLRKFSENGKKMIEEEGLSLVKSVERTEKIYLRLSKPHLE